MVKAFLNSAQVLNSAEDTREFYQEWAASYDEEIEVNGYSSPYRTAHALVQCGAALDQPVLDIGCGSGISGLFLQKAGFAELHGSDFSSEMLKSAKKKGIYKALNLVDLRNPFESINKVFRTITAIGVFAPGHAQPDVIESVVNLLPESGLFGFSLNDHTMEDPGYLEEIFRLVFERKVRIRWQEYGEHLPGIKLNSLIIVLEKR